MILGEDKWLLFTGRHFWNRKCRKKTWWQQEFAVFKCEATANSVTGHVCVNSNDKCRRKRREVRPVSYLEDFEKTLAEKCHQNEPPFCQAACPFRLDIKGLEEKWKKGRFNAAYRTYQNTVGFPDIVSKLCSHPCEKACLRAKLDGESRSGFLERATVEYAKRKAPNAYNLPSKGKKIAIVGGGLSGLGCALRLCNKKYEVTVYEREMVLGGQARNQMDPAEFDAEIEAQFQFEEFSRHLGETVADLEALRADYDAVYVATGADGADFGLEMDPDGAFATRTQGVFIGGSLTGGDSMKALADGLAVSLAIERYLKTGGMNEPFRKEGTLLNLQTNGIERADRVVPANGESYTEEEAMQEITRCQKCSCDACMRACDLMRLHEKTPRRLYEEVYITIHPGTFSRDGTWATRLISTCDHCGLCKEVCPQHIDFSQFLLDSMRAMQKKARCRGHSTISGSATWHMPPEKRGLRGNRRMLRRVPMHSFRDASSPVRIRAM